MNERAANCAFAVKKLNSVCDVLFSYHPDTLFNGSVDLTLPLKTDLPIFIAEWLVNLSPVALDASLKQTCCKRVSSKIAV